MRSSWEQISWWRSSIFLVTSLTNQTAAKHSWEWIHCLTNQRAEWSLMAFSSSHFLYSVLIKCFSLNKLIFLVFFEHWLWFSCTIFSASLLSGWGTNWSMFDCTWLFTHARCAAANTRDGGGKKKQWERRPQRRGGYVYLYTKWCMRRPRTTQLDPVSVNTVTPPSDTHEHSRGNRLAPLTLFFFAFYSSFLFYSLCSQDLLHSSGWAFLKLWVGSSLVTKEEDESRHV